MAALLWLGCTETQEDLGRVRRSLASEQDRLAFPDTYLGTESIAVARVFNHGDVDVHVRAELAEGAGGFSVVDVETDVRAGSAGTIRVRFQPFRDGEFQGALRLAHDGESDSGSVLVVALAGRTAEPPDCNDGNVCTADAFDPNVAGLCRHLPIDGNCDDGSVCTAGDSCQLGECRGTPISCEDGIACTADTCDPVAGCVFLPTASLCADGDVCTVDACTPDVAGADPSGCTHVIAPDGSLCGEPSCGALPLCLQGACTTMIAPAGYPCEDGDPCTLGDACAAGTCLPGEGGAFNATPPVIVRDVGPQMPPFSPEPDGGVPPAPVPPPLEDGGSGEADVEVLNAQPIAGQWPVALDAVGTAMLDRGAGPQPHALMLWRGATDSDECYLNPQACARAVGCPTTDTVWNPAPLQLNASAVTLDGATVSHVRADFQSVHQQMMMTNIGLWTWQTPPSSVASVSAQPVASGVAGAAVVRFGSNCAACTEPGTAPPSPGPSGGEGGAAAPPECFPEGLGVVVMHATSERIAVVDGVWLESGAESLGMWTVLREIDDGAPIVATAVDGDRLAVVYGRDVQIDCAACDEPCDLDCEDCCACDCPASAQLIAREYAIDLQATTPLTFLRQQEIQIMLPGGSPARLSKLRAAYLGGELTVSWVQASSSAVPTPPVCGYLAPPQTNNAYLVHFAITNAMLPQPELIGANVVDAARLAHAEGTVVLSWTRALESSADEVACWMADAIATQDSDDGVELVRRTSSVEGLLYSAELASVGGRAYAAATGQGGTLVVAAPATPQQAALVRSTTFAQDVDAQIHPGGAVRIAALGHGVLLGAFAEVNIWRNSLPQPALSLTTMACGAGVSGP